MAEAAGSLVACGRCGLALDERSDTPADKRQPCPRCWSMNRTTYDPTPPEKRASTGARGLTGFVRRSTGH
jgi:hypothetical protein